MHYGELENREYAIALIVFITDDHSLLDFKSAVQCMKCFIYHFTVIIIIIIIIITIIIIIIVMIINRNS